MKLDVNASTCVAIASLQRRTPPSAWRVSAPEQCCPRSAQPLLRHPPLPRRSWTARSSTTRHPAPVTSLWASRLRLQSPCAAYVSLNESQLTINIRRANLEWSKHLSPSSSYTSFSVLNGCMCGYCFSCLFGSTNTLALPLEKNTGVHVNNKCHIHTRSIWLYRRMMTRPFMVCPCLKTGMSMA